VAWSLVATFDGAAYAPEVVEAIVDSFMVTGVPALVDPGPPDEELVALAAGAPRFEGALLPPYITGADPDVGLGASAPTVSGTDFDDRPTGIVHDGTPKAIVFMAHWCPHCQNEVPAVQAWLEETGGVDGVEIITVITAYAPSRGNWSPRDWLESEGWTPDVIRDDATGSIHTAYGAGGFPYWVFLDGEGTVALRWAGAIEVVNLEMIFEAMAAG
jgi:thiol-disulfide isomerase/thioredoxin